MVDGQYVDPTGLNSGNPFLMNQSQQPNTVSPNTNAPPMVAGRKRRQQGFGHRRTQSGTSVSIGSMVGQSSLLTAPTMGSTSDSEQSASSLRRGMQQMQLAQRKMNNFTGADEGRDICKSKRRGTGVRDDVKNFLSTPIRVLGPKSKSKPSLKRASGMMA